MIYPAHAGINLPGRPRRRGRADLPRTRGDKPANVAPLTGIGAIYPAHAGINQEPIMGDVLFWHLPRTRGDKPVTEHSDLLTSLSTPHTRG